MARSFLAGAVAAAALFVAGGASAAAFDFSVLYSGANVAALAPGSDPLVGTTLTDGDTFTYTLSATGGDVWTALTGGESFPFAGLPVNESAVRNVSFTLTLKNAGLAVFALSETGNQSNVHLGTNTVSVTMGTVFDEIFLEATLNSGGSSTFSSLLPIFGAPEMNSFYPGVFSYGGGGGVPEPATWGLMIAGFGLAGVALRRRRAVAFA